MKRRSLEISLIAALVVTLTWTTVSPGFESATSFIMALCALLGVEYSSPHESLVHSVYSAIQAWFHRILRSTPPPAAVLLFTTLESGQPVQQRIRVVRLYADGEPTEIMWLMHWSFVENRYVLIDTLEGHSAELFALDFDGDHLPELAVRWACGTHTRRFRLYKITNGRLELVPGTEIATEWPEIEWADSDSDGKLEIYSLDQNHLSPESGPISIRHVYRDGRYQRDTTS